MHEASPDRMLSSEELAAYLGVTMRLVRDWRIKGTGPRGVSLGRRTVRYPLSEVERWLDERRRADPLHRHAGAE
jgi:predicted DNA-binding transcriptional regulator AlpA